MPGFQPTPDMTYSRLGRTDLEVSTVGLGCWTLGGIKWGPVKEDDAIAAIHEGLDRGINFFDTSPVYGKGQSEIRLSRVAEERRDEMIIATKGGLRIDRDGSYYTNYEPSAILEEFDASRERLGTDVIDLYQLHWPPESQTVDGAWNRLLDLHRDGAVRALGICHFPLGDIRRLRELGGLDAVQVRYNMIQRNAEEKLIPYCRKHGISVLTCTSLAKGLLTAKYDQRPSFEEWDNRHEDPLFEEDQFDMYQSFARDLDKIARDLDVPTGALSLAWTRSRPGVTSALAGARTDQQVQENAIGGGLELEEKHQKQLNDLLEDHGFDRPDDSGT